MTLYRDALPQLSPEVFLTDSGLETELIYNQGVELQQFAAFPLLDDAAGVRRLRSYFAGHAAIAVRADVGSSSSRSPGERTRTGAHCSATTATPTESCLTETLSRPPFRPSTTPPTPTLPTT